MPQNPVIVWFRSDLRIADHPALHEAAKTGAPVLPLYIVDTDAEKPLGAASEWWLHHSLTRLQGDLKDIGLVLRIVTGNPEISVPAIAQHIGAQAVCWNRRYDGYGVAKDTAIKTLLADNDIEAHSFKGNLLREPWEMKTGSGGWYKVFTPYWKACLADTPPADPLPAPKNPMACHADIDGQSIADLDLLPTKPDWSGGLAERFTPGSSAAHEKLAAFIKTAVEDYPEDRDRPAKHGTSRLSAHLAFGEISPRQVWAACKKSGKDCAKFLAEIGWREFSYVLLFYNPKLGSENYKPAFDGFSWREDAAGLKAWQDGMTGYPMVDAGMRELYATGWQHNRVRMITASFLIKHLLVHWTQGEKWFWDTLVDADPASNAAGWQWVAGSGADASPYFRIFNPFTQGEKFDPEGDYIRRWIPEIGKLPKKYIHRPWEAPQNVLDYAGVTLGKTYPKPIVEHKAARERALAAYKDSRSGD